MPKPEWVEKPAEYDHNKSLHENKKRSRGILRCHCGNNVDLHAAQFAPDYVAKCDQCGQLFNLVGQELIPRNQWE
jgi:hypothetical protein